MWAYFLRKPVDKNYQNSPNLVTLVAGEDSVQKYCDTLQIVDRED